MQWRIVQCTAAQLDGKSPLNATKCQSVEQVFSIPGEASRKQLSLRENAIALQVYRKTGGLSTQGYREGKKCSVMRIWKEEEE